MTLPQQLQAARLLLAKSRPYLATAAWALQPVQKPGVGTMAVDMYWRLYYDPAVLDKWTAEEMQGVLYHEICHLLRNHADRMMGKNQRLSNIAADAEINDDLIREKVKFPIHPVTPGFFGMPENLLAEEYYAMLERLGENPPTEQTQDNTQSDASDGGSDAAPPNNGQDIPSDKQEGNKSAADSPDEHKEGQKSCSDQKQADDETPAPGAGRCGSCATGQKAPWEDEPPGKGAPGLNKTEAELIRRDIANQIREYSRSQGRVPGHWARWAEEKLDPKIDWRKQLAAAVRYAAADANGATDYSYRRPSRRQGQVGNGDVIFPSLRCPVPSVAIVADTSASVSDHMMAQTLAEISGILKALGHTEGVHVLAVDQTVQSCRKVFRPEQIQLAGGGGTNMGAGLKAAASLKPLPQLGIVLTDGHTSWPDRPPRGMKVIVVLSGDGKAPEWANVIQNLSFD